MIREDKTMVTWEHVAKTYQEIGSLKMQKIIDLIDKWKYKDIFYPSTSLSLLSIETVNVIWHECNKYNRTTVEARDQHGIYHSGTPEKDYRIQFYKGVINDSASQPEYIINCDEDEVENVLKEQIEKL